MQISAEDSVKLLAQRPLEFDYKEIPTHDYEVNLKAETEIMAQHEKLDEPRSEDLAGLIAQLNKTRRWTETGNLNLMCISYAMPRRVRNCARASRRAL